MERTGGVLAIRRAVKPGRVIETKFTSTQENRGVRGVESRHAGNLQDAAVTQEQATCDRRSDGAGVRLPLRQVDRTFVIDAVVIIGISDDEREGSRQHIGAGDRQGGAGLRRRAQSIGGGGAARRGKSRAREHGVASVGAEPGFDVWRSRQNLGGQVGRKIRHPAEPEGETTGLPALIVGNQEIFSPETQVAAGRRKATEDDALASAIASAQRDRRGRVIVDILEDDQLVGADVIG